MKTAAAFKIGSLGLVLAAALAACAPSFSVQLDPESRGFYETARLIMTDEELAVFTHLPDAESRREFIKEFWDKRDPDPDTEVNEAKQEFDRRIEYINKRFREGRKGIDTDRGRIYLYLGPPEKTEEYPMMSGGQGGELLWVYYKYDLGIYFVDPSGMGHYTIGEIEGNLFDAIEMAKIGVTFSDRNAPDSLLKFDLTYDKSRHEFRLTIPAKKLSFKDEGGTKTADFDFTFYIYKEGGLHKEMFVDIKHFAGTADALEKSPELVFTFSRELPPGKIFVDVVVDGRAANGKSRKIFTFNN
jgi:GWxTD domain-containing protein